MRNVLLARCVVSVQELTRRVCSCSSHIPVPFHTAFAARPHVRCTRGAWSTLRIAGLLFTHWVADSLTLWKSPETQTDVRLWTAATYYSILSRMPLGLAYSYAVVALAGGATILWSLRDGRAGNLMFDGGSICT